MKILVLTSVYPQPNDQYGVTATVKYFCDEWARQGHDVIVVHNNNVFPKLFYCVPKIIQNKLMSKLGHNFPSKEGRKYLTRLENNVKIYRIPIKKYIPYGRFLKKTINNHTDKIIQILSDENFNPDIIIGHWLNPQIILISNLKRCYKAKTALVFHNDCTKKNLKHTDIEKHLANIDVIGCRNISYAIHVQNMLSLSYQPFICYSGLPNSLVNNLKKENIIKNKEEHTYLFVGRLVKYKNVDVVIKALYKVYKEKYFKFDIIGEGEEINYLKNLVKSLNLQNKVFFHESVKREEVFEYMKKSSVFIMVSKNETFGMVYLESMLMGNITIGSKNCGIDGIIKDGHNGFLCEQENTLELEAKINRLCQMNQEEKKQMRIKAMNCAIKFSDYNVSQKYLNDILQHK